ncbi:MAG: hypothetical protein RJB34_805 [Pseudomonadota bacterium]|jgi:CRISPR-associated protein Csd1
MILSSLNDLYHRLLANPDPVSGLPRVPPYGFTDESISYCLVLSRAGELADIQDVRDTSGKKPRPKLHSVPRPPKKSVNISPNFLWGNSQYVLGLSKKSFKNNDVKDYFFSFKNYLGKLVGESKDDSLKAVVNFLTWWETQDFTSELIKPEHLDQNFIFKIDGSAKFIHELSSIQSLWVSLVEGAVTESSRSQCLITGAKKQSIARLHDAVSGGFLKNYSSKAEWSLVSFNQDAFKSYAQDQGICAPVSEQASFAYTTALNYLLRRENGHCISIGDTSTVFWAQAANTKQEQLAVGLFGAFFNPQPTDESQNLKLGLSLEKISKGRPFAEIAPELDPSTRFFVLGLAPNSARLSIRYWLDTQFGILETNLQKHRQALLVEPLPWREEKAPGIWRFMLELTPCRWKVDGTKEKRKPEDIPPHLAGEFFRSVITGGHYPSSLLSKLIQRMRSDGDISGLRVAMVKAVLCRNFERSVPMGLNENEESIAYQLGCQFALCELAQRVAIGKVNAGVKDKFFSSASATPKTVFANLYRNFNHHVSALRKGKKADDWPGDPQKLAGWLEARTGKILAHIESNKGFPYQMSLADQGMFVLGYYHQKFHRAKDPAISAPETDSTSSEDDQGDQS